MFSMNATAICDILHHKVNENSPVILQGWVRSRRDSKSAGGLSFIALHDGSCFDTLQIVATGELVNYQSEVLHITAGCSLRVTGKLVRSQGKGQSWEVLADQITLIGPVDDPDTYPIQPKAHSFEYLRTVAHLRPRTNTFGAIARIRHCLSMAVHRFFHEHGFYWIHTPIITASDCEGAGALFRVSTLDLHNLPMRDPHRGIELPRSPIPDQEKQRRASDKSPSENQMTLASPAGHPAASAIDFSQDFFGKETFLTVSGQLNVETYCCALSKVYTFGPTFRAENSNTTRHLSEFWMIEPEIAFADLAEDAALAEAFLKSIFTTLLTERADDMAFFAQRIDKDCLSRLEKMIAAPFEHMTYTQAVTRLEKAVAAGRRFEFPVRWGMDLQSEHERYLTEEFVRGPVVLTDYPKEIKAFYMRLNDDGKTVAAMDVLLPGVGEIIGGSQREERLSVLDARLEELKLHKSSYGWYRDLRRYGTVPHAGFGLGFERAILYATGMTNIRDVIPFPRTPGHAEF